MQGAWGAKDEFGFGNSDVLAQLIVACVAQAAASIEATGRLQALTQRILADIETLIANEGTLVSAHDWGRRKMAYEIKHKPEAEYHLLQFHGPNALLERLDRTLRITDSVIRYRIIKLAPGTPDPPDLTASATVATEGGQASDED